MSKQNAVLYSGFFLDVDSEVSLLRFERDNNLSLPKVPDSPMHVTFGFKEDVIPFTEEFLGRELLFRVVGFTVGGKTRGFSVEIPNELRQFYNNTGTPHITSSLDHDASPADTKDANFVPIEPFYVKGRLGYYMSNRDIMDKIPKYTLDQELQDRLTNKTQVFLEDTMHNVFGSKRKLHDVELQVIYDLKMHVIRALQELGIPLVEEDE
jgi:hypothetical protein